MKRRGFVSRGGGGSCEHPAHPPPSRLPPRLHLLDPVSVSVGAPAGANTVAGPRAHADSTTAAFAARAAPARTGKRHGTQIRLRPFPFLRRLTIMRALSGPIAQLGERCVRNAEVGSSILLRSTIFKGSDFLRALSFWCVPRVARGSGDPCCGWPSAETPATGPFLGQSRLFSPFVLRAGAIHGL